MLEAPRKKLMEGSKMSVVKLINEAEVRTHRNEDGTYDASIAGVKMGLKCQFSYSARVVALRQVAEALETQQLAFERINPVTKQWEPATVYEFVAEITRPGAGLRYTDFFKQLFAMRRVCTVTLNGLDMSRWSYQSRWTYNR